MNRNSESFDQIIDSGINFRDVLNRYLRNWIWFLFSIVFFLSLGYVYIKLQIPQYKIETDILIKDNKGTSSDEKDLLEQLDLNSSNKIIDNEIQILKSNTLMEKVVNSLGLQTSYYIQNHISKIILYKNTPFDVQLLRPSSLSYTKDWLVKLNNQNQAEFDGKAVDLNKPVITDAGLILITLNPSITYKRPVYVTFNNTADLAQEYIDNLKIEAATKDATVLIITLQDAVPLRGKEILNKLVEEYNQAGIEDKNITLSNQLNFIQGRLDNLSGELSSAEQKVQNYKSANNITIPSQDAQVFLNAVKDNDQAMTLLDVQLGVLNNLENYLTAANPNDQNKLPSTLGIEDPTIEKLISQIAEAQEKKESLLRTVPETNPVVSSINDQISDSKKTLLQTVENLRNGLNITKNQLDEKNKQFGSLIKNVPSVERGLIDVMRQQDIKSNLFIYLLQKREETGLKLASTVSDSRIIDVAKCDGLPISPVKRILYLVFLMFGLFIPVIVIYLKEALNFKVGKRSDIEKITATPILGEISYTDDQSALITVDRPRSMVAEQIRSMRTNLQFINVDSKAKTLLFTSNISGEGKSFVSLNLGASLASTGKKVVILELDLRKPKLHASLGLDNNIGISNYLIGSVSINDIIKPVAPQANYFIITSGAVPPNPAELLLNGRLDNLVDELKKEYDFILFDAPPVGLVTDAQILSKWADCTLFIVRQNYTLKDQINLIDDLYQKKSFKNLFIIFNSVERRNGYGYGYGYGNGYYEEDKTKKGLLSRLYNTKK